MAKYPCELIQDLIPLYIENDTSKVTNEIVEKHIKDCKECRTLVNDYSNDSLKLVVLEEDLPQSETFKKWMKKLKVLGVVSLSMMLIAAIIIGVAGYKIGANPKNELLSQKDLIKIFEEQGITLTKEKTNYYGEFKLNGVTPVTFSLAGNKGSLVIYTFKSYEDCEIGISDGNKLDTAPFSMFNSFKVKNNIILYIAGSDNTTEMKYVDETKIKICDIIIKHIYDGKELNYKGENSNWEGNYTLKYYESWWQDKSGNHHQDFYGEQLTTLKYKGSDISSIKPFNFKCATPKSTGEIQGAELDKNGYLKLEEQAGSTTLNERQNILFTINCNDKEEEISLSYQK